MRRKRFSWTALAMVALAGVVAVSAAAALDARSTASPFELVTVDHYEGVEFDAWFRGGTFTAGAPFCESGATDLESEPWFAEAVRRRYTCADGSGSLVLAERVVSSLPYVGGEWTIVEGSGRYAGLRGKGDYLSEQLSDQPGLVYRTSMRGFADYDSVAPSVAITSARATKLSPRAGTYTIRVALSLRDDVEGNPVRYSVGVTEGPQHPRDRGHLLLDVKDGSTTSGSVSMRLHVWPSSKRVRSLQLQVSGSDPVGNEVTLVRSLELPR
jgi:hypothetical protein